MTTPAGPTATAPQEGAFARALARFALVLVGFGVCVVNGWLLWHEEHETTPASTTHLAFFLGGIGFGVLVILAAIPGAVAAVTDSAKSILGAIFPFVARWRNGNAGSTP